MSKNATCGWPARSLQAQDTLSRKAGVTPSSSPALKSAPLEIIMAIVPIWVGVVVAASLGQTL